MASASATPWSILVSEIMLQQTPVSRVLPAHAAWLGRWPEPAALAADTPADAVRQWDRLGYPRRAVRLHASAELITNRHGGQVPDSADQLRSLPGVGSYTAAAVAAFAYGRRHPVLDTNVRRVLTRLVSGDFLPRPALTVAEVRLAESLLPAGRQARGSVVGGRHGTRCPCLHCGPPTLPRLPGPRQCAWLSQGQPAATSRRPTARYEGSDRQSRGRLLAVLRAASGPVPAAALDAAWHDSGQRARALAALIDDGLIIRCADGSLALPGERAASGERAGPGAGVPA